MGNWKTIQMTVKKLSVEETIKAYTNENGFSWGINTVMKSLVNNTYYDLSISEGQYTINFWDGDLPPPTSQEIRDEYIRQQTIAECLDYFENKKFKWKFFLKKLKI